MQLNNLKSQFESQMAIAGVDEVSFGKETVTKYYKQSLDSAYNFFGKND
jgi:hypothetical protein